MSLVPVSASGPHTIIDNEIFLGSSGQQVMIEIRYAYDSLDRLVRSYQATVDSSGYTSSSAQGVLSPVPVLSKIDVEHPDYVFVGLTSIPAVDATFLDYRYAATILSRVDCVQRPNESLYARTLVVNVSPDASGMFTVGVLDGVVATRLNDCVDTPFGPLTTLAVRITVP